MVVECCVCGKELFHKLKQTKRVTKNSLFFCGVYCYMQYYLKKMKNDLL